MLSIHCAAYIRFVLFIATERKTTKISLTENTISTPIQMWLNDAINAIESPKILLAIIPGWQHPFLVSFSLYSFDSTKMLYAKKYWLIECDSILKSVRKKCMEQRIYWIHEIHFESIFCYLMCIKQNRTKGIQQIEFPHKFIWRFNFLSEKLKKQMSIQIVDGNISDPFISIHSMQFVVKSTSFVFTNAFDPFLWYHLAKTNKKRTNCFSSRRKFYATQKRNYHIITTVH